MLRFFFAATAFFRASARNCSTCCGLTGCGLVVAMANQLDALSVPDVGNECVALGKPPIELLGSENSVVDFAVECLFGLANPRSELGLAGSTDDEQVNVAGRVGLVLRKRSVEPG